MTNSSSKVKQFCLIQLEILKGREQRLRKEILDCKIQTEYLTSVLTQVDSDYGEKNKALNVILWTPQKKED